MKRIHNTESPIIDLTKTYGQNRCFNQKPNGLWYSIENEWENWCNEQMPSWIKQNWFTLDLETKNILLISSPKDLLWFFKKYQKIKYGYSMVDWGLVKMHYKGIEIQNYQDLKIFSLELFDNIRNYLWLYSWDINSGCVWDLSSIRSVTKN